MAQRTDIAAIPLGALSAVLLGLQVFQSRLVAYSVPTLMINAVVGVALLGFGAAGSLVAMRPTWLTPARLARALAWSALAFCVSIVVAHALFVRMTPLLLRVDVFSLALALVLGAPFIAGGTLVALVVTSSARVGAAYAVSLIGSGIGCFLPLILLGPFDAEHLLGVFALLAWACALPYVLDVRGRSLALRIATAGALALAALGYAYAPAVFPIEREPAPSGQLDNIYRYAKDVGLPIRKVYDRWNATGRIEVVGLSAAGPEPYPAFFFAEDSSAGSLVIQWDGRTKSQVQPSASDAGTLVARLCSETLYAQGYDQPRARVLMIGLGGGLDLECALYQEAEQIDVVETNPDSIAMLEQLGAWVGSLGRARRVAFHERDGRGFVHGTQAAFDLIVLSGVGTKNNAASGVPAQRENQLYTLEAFRDYVTSLRANGAIAIVRFGEPEALRVAHTAVTALRRLGVAHPERQIAIARTGAAYGIVIRKQPWNAAELLAYQQRLQSPHFRGAKLVYYEETLGLGAMPAIEYMPSLPRVNPFGFYFDAVAHDAELRAIEIYPFDIAATTDERPFFFDLWRYDAKAPPVILLRNLLVSMLAIALALMVLPLRRMRARAGMGRGVMLPLYFASVGLGFIALEAWLLHRFTTFLGHGMSAFGVVLTTLLVTAGLGAAWGERLMPEPGRRARVGAAGVALVLGLLAPVLPPVLEATWQLELAARAAIAIAFILPAGLALGQPFVAGLCWVRGRDAAGVPWYIGVHGVSSAIGSVAVIPLLVAAGYAGCLYVGITCYLIGALLALAMRA